MEQEIGCEHGRRRRWSLEEKRAVVELSLDPESSVVEVAAAFDLVPAQIYAWRRELREVDIRDDEAPMFLPAVAEPASSPAFMTEPDVAPSLLPSSAVQMALQVGGVPVVIAHGASPELAACVIDVLARVR